MIEKKDSKQESHAGLMTVRTKQSLFLSIPLAPLIFWVSLISSICSKGLRSGQSVIKTKQGIVTGNNDRFLRYFWEAVKARAGTIHT